MARAQQVFGQFVLEDKDEDEPTDVPPAQREEQLTEEAYQRPLCMIRVFKPSTHTLGLLKPMEEEEA